MLINKEIEIQNIDHLGIVAGIIDAIGLVIACEHLIGAGVKPEYLNDDKLGRVMDKLFIKGLDTTFLTINYLKSRQEI